MAARPSIPLALVLAAGALGCASKTAPPADPAPPAVAPAPAPAAQAPSEPAEAPPAPAPMVQAPTSMGAEAPGPCTHRALRDQSPAELRLTRNAVFARYGRVFTSEDLDTHFRAQPWYVPDPAYDDGRLTEVDHACVARVGVFEGAAGILWRDLADLDGDGAAEAISVIAHDPLLVEGQASDADNPCDAGCAATLMVGPATAPITFYWAQGAYFAEKEARVIDIDPEDNRREVAVTHRRGDWEDPPYLNRVFLFSGGALRAFDLDGEGYDTGKLAIPGDGRIGLVDSDCATRTTTWYALKGGALVKGAVEVTEAPGAEDFRMPDGSYACPACPVVYAGAAPGGEPLGEILRNLATPKRKGWQRLHLPASVAEVRGEVATVTLTLAEEKAEVTHLDAVRLIASGAQIEPGGCAKAPAPWCAADGQALRLAPGQRQSFVFEVPAAAAAGGMWLEALGHYEPILDRGIPAKDGR